MNKQQIIAPLVAMVAFVLVVGFYISHKESRGFLRARADAVGEELIHTTNSTTIRLLGPDLRARLEQLLASPTTIEVAQVGDEPKPIGDGQASVRLYLRNKEGARIGIRLRWDSDAKKFDVLGFWIPYP